MDGKAGDVDGKRRRKRTKVDAGDSVIRPGTRKSADESRAGDKQTLDHPSPANGRRQQRGKPSRKTAASSDSGESTQGNQALLQAIRILSSPPNGTFDHPTVEGLLALARAGSSIWNAWRFENREFFPNFSNCALGDVDFSGCVFTLPAHASSCASFARSRIDNLRCIGTEFRGPIAFCDARIVHSADFRNAVFSGPADFEGFGEARFLDPPESARIAPDVERNARLGLHATRPVCNFSNCRFEKGVSFAYTIFSYGDFSRINVSGSSDFTRATFHENGDFTDASLGEAAHFVAAVFMGTASFQILTHANSSTLNAMTVTAMDFSGAIFKGKSTFTNRHFAENTSFGMTNTAVCVPDHSMLGRTHYYQAGGITTFHRAPDFHGCLFHQSIDLHYTNFVQEYGEEAAICYRTLRMTMEQIKAVREEQRFFRMEMHAERTTQQGWRNFFSTFYWLLSDFGLSPIRPLILTGVMAMIFTILHNGLSTFGWSSDLYNGCHSAIKSDPNLHRQYIARYVITNAIPLPGTEKTQEFLRNRLFDECKRPWVMTVASILELMHRATSLVALFLLGLSLRNLFKMKS